MSVRETVPDSILDRTDAIELVDITPDDLIQRLREGKVYVPKQAHRALEHFLGIVANLGESTVAVANPPTGWPIFETRAAALTGRGLDGHATAVFIEDPT